MNLRKAALLLVLLLIILVPSVGMSAEDMLVYVIPLKNDISPGTAGVIERGLQTAAGAGADLVVIEIATPGGLIDSALDIKEVIIDSPVRVVAFVKGRAWSAGALIALAAERIYMAPSSSIGAAEPRPLDEKVLSAWVSELEATAERRGRDPQIARAMADAAVEIPGVVEEGKLLTLTAKRALELGFIDGVVSTRAELLEELGFSGARIVEIKVSTAERLAQFVTSPTIGPLLLSIGFLGIILELFTAGWGVPGTLGVIALVTYFGAYFIAGLAGLEVLVLFILGVILLMVEAFMPGFGVFGIAGIISIGASLFFASSNAVGALQSLVVSILATLLLVVVFARLAAKKGWFNRLLLTAREDKESGYVAPREHQELLGETGTTLTILRPSGVASINGRRVDVVSESGFIPQGRKIEVISIEGPRVVVREVAEDDSKS